MSETAQRGIGGERAEKRLRANKLLGGVPDLAGGEEQEAVVLEESPSPDLAHRLYVFVVVGKRCSQFLGARAGEFRTCPIHHHQKRIGLLRKCRIELQFALAPGQARGDELAGIRVDRKIFVGVEDSAESEQQV